MSSLADHAYWIRERLEEEDYQDEAERKQLEKEYRTLIRRLIARTAGKGTQ